MVRIAARRVRSRHLLDKGLEARGRERVLGGIWEKVPCARARGSGQRGVAGDVGSAKGSPQLLPGLGDPVS